MEDWKKQLEDVLRQIPGYNPWDLAGDSWLDHEAALHAINWFPEHLKHVEGSARGEPFILRTWQAAIVGNLFGWKRKDEAGRIVRRYRKSLIFVARGNGKTPLAAGIVLYAFYEDGEPGAQCYLAAGQREQAGYLFRNACGFVDQNPGLGDRVTIYRGDQHRSMILRDDPLSFCKVIPADAAGQHGGIPHISVVDELHVQENRDLVDVFESGMRKKVRSQPLLVMITTADYDRPSICNEVYATACAVRDNGGDPSKPGYDSSFLPVIYEVPQGVDWRDEAKWSLANPNIDVSVSREQLRIACRDAQEIPAKENTFRRLNLNQRTSQDMRIVSMTAWDACKGELDDAELAGVPCFGGLDLASIEDLAAFCLAFGLPDGRIALRVRAWCPESKVADRARKKIPYDVWERQGWIVATEGDRIDYDRIHADVLADCERFGCKEIAYDSWGAEKPRQDLERAGLVTVNVPPTFLHLSAATKDLLARIKGRTIVHDGNPVLRWAMSNAAAHFDGKLPPGEKIENHLDRMPIMLSKRKSTDKIDPAATVVLALSRHLANPQQQRSAYEDAEPMVIG